MGFPELCRLFAHLLWAEGLEEAIWLFGSQAKIAAGVVDLSVLTAPLTGKGELGSRRQVLVCRLLSWVLLSRIP